MSEIKPYEEFYKREDFVVNDYTEDDTADCHYTFEVGKVNGVALYVDASGYERNGEPVVYYDDEKDDGSVMGYYVDPSAENTEVPYPVPDEILTAVYEMTRDFVEKERCVEEKEV